MIVVVIVVGDGDGDGDGGVSNVGRPWPISWHAQFSEIGRLSVLHRICGHCRRGERSDSPRSRGVTRPASARRVFRSAQHRRGSRSNFRGRWCAAFRDCTGLCHGVCGGARRRSRSGRSSGRAASAGSRASRAGGCHADQVVPVVQNVAVAMRARAHRRSVPRARPQVLR